MDEPSRRRGQRFYGSLLGSLFLFGFGGWHVIMRDASFTVGGSWRNPERRMHVDAHGPDAVAIGLFFIGLGFVNLALGIDGPRRFPVFWLGAALFSGAVLYGLWKVVLEVGSSF